MHVKETVMVSSTTQVIQQAHRIGMKFLLVDLATALTFLDLSEATGSDETRKRNRQNARTAYGTVLRLLPRFKSSGEERSAVEAKLIELKTRLSALGCLPEPETV
jgi:hypothetical protein